MADVRALLKSKRQEQRITHPYVSYTQSGQLRCKACDMIVKHASAWNGHVGSKEHRTVLAKLKEEALVTLKRKNDDLVSSDAGDNISTKKRKLDEMDQSAGLVSKTADFPADFFSDPTRIIHTQDDSDGTEDEDDSKKVQQSIRLPVQEDPKEKATGDEVLHREWAAFQSSILNDDDREVTIREVFERATVFAEPELVNELPEGIPEFVNLQRADVAEPTPPKALEQLDEAGALKRRQEDERELIMDRLVEEERYQEEADERVSLLKARLDLIKHRRMLAKQTKQS